HWSAGPFWTASQVAPQNDRRSAEQFARSRVLEERRRLPVGEAGFAKLAERLVACQDEQQHERPAFGRAFSQPLVAVEVVHQPFELGAAVGALAVDEILSGRID